MFFSDKLQSIYDEHIGDVKAMMQELLEACRVQIIELTGSDSHKIYDALEYVDKVYRRFANDKHLDSESFRDYIYCNLYLGGIGDKSFYTIGWKVDEKLRERMDAVYNVQQK